MINTPQQVAGVSTVDAPAAIANGANYLLAWTDSDQSIWWNTCPATSNQSSYDWTKSAAVPNAASSSGPSLASLAGKVWIAWKGESADTRIFLSSLNGSTWSTPSPLSGIGTSSAPALTAIGSTLLLVFKGQSDTKLYWSKSTDGTAWSAAVEVPAVLTSDTPALASFNGVVHLAVKGASDTSIWQSSYTDAGGWGTQSALPSDHRTSSGPALGFGNTGNLHLVFKGESDLLLWESALNPGKTVWSTPGKVGTAQTSTRPALASQPSAATDILLAFKGGSTTNLYAAPIDGIPEIFPATAQAGPDSLTYMWPAPFPPAPPSGPTASDGVLFGGGASAAVVAAKLVLTSDGTAIFTGWYQDTGSVPVFDAPAQNYTAAVAILTPNKKLFTFSNTNNNGVATGGAVDTWIGTQKNAEIANNWAALTGPGVVIHFSCSNTTNAGSLLGAIINAVEAVAGYVETAVEVIGIIALVAV